MTHKILAVCIALMAFCAVQIGHAQAADSAQDAQRIYETHLSQMNTSMSGVSASRQEYFQLLNYWNVSEATVKLDYQASQITKDYISSVTLSLNGSKFYSFRPLMTDNGKQQLSVSIPKELLQKGTNSLKIEGNLRTTTDIQACSNDVTPDNWLRLYDTSSVEVRYGTEPFKGTISDFNQRFTGLDTVRAGKSLITVPDHGDETELEAAIYALSGFAKTNSLTDTEIPLLPYRADTIKNREYMVLISMYDHLPSELKSALGSSIDVSNQALLQVVNKDNQQTLVVTSKDQGLLLKAGRFIQNQTLMGQVSSGTKLIGGDTDVATPAITISKNVSFTETGDELKGLYHQEKDYFISLPANRSIADAGKISLDFRYAQNLDFNRSLMTVSINNTPIGSKKLSNELANGDTATFSIPKNLAVSGNFTVTVGFDLELANSVCTPNQDQMPWAFITKDSMMQLNTKDRTELLFNSYPYPFLRDEIYNHVAVVLPNAQDDFLYSTVTNVFNLLGRYASGNTGDVRVYADSVTPAELKGRNILAIGSYQNNKIIRDNNGSLYFQYDSSGTTIKSNEKMSIEAEYGKRIGTLQLIPSPYEAGRGFMAVTGAAPQNYYLAAKLLANEKTRWKAYGDAVITDKDGNSSAFRFKGVTGEARDSLLKEVTKRSDVMGFLAAFLLVMSMVVVSLFLLIRKHMKRRGGSNEKPSK